MKVYFLLTHVLTSIINQMMNVNIVFWTNDLMSVVLIKKNGFTCLFIHEIVTECPFSGPPVLTTRNSRIKQRRHLWPPYSRRDVGTLFFLCYQTYFWGVSSGWRKGTPAAGSSERCWERRTGSTHLCQRGAAHPLSQVQLGELPLVQLSLFALCLSNEKIASFFCSCR